MAIQSQSQPKLGTYQIRPNGPLASSAESWRLSTIDHIVTQHYSNWAVIFKLADEQKPAILDVIKRGLEATLGQARHLAGKIEINEHGDFSIVKRPDSSVRLDVRWLDGPEDKYPSFSEIEKGLFSAQSLGDPARLTIEGMTMACQGHPRDCPDAMGFQANFIPGGLIFTVHRHHLVADVSGLASIIRTIADNCAAVVNGTGPPAWDDAFMDRSRWTSPPVPIEDQVAPPPARQRHPDWHPCSWLLFHIPESKVTEIKRLASPTDESWISTYDALVAVIWRVLMKNRAQIYKPDLSTPAIFMEAINMRSRINPSVSERYQGNLLCGGLSFLHDDVPTLAEVISEAPLSRLATFIRKVTNSVTEESLTGMLNAATMIRDKSTLHQRMDSAPPMSMSATDWRKARICDYDFGFGRPVAARLVSDTVFDNMVMIYPPRRGEGIAASSPGIEVVIPFETHAIDLFKDDPEVKEYFEFRGVETGRF
ncbi:transferase family-domain-containing protein [Nemania sp. FL0916]|nr:transferase family-domain-containing protein [Nemania sp. FL0916]